MRVCMRGYTIRCFPPTTGARRTARRRRRRRRRPARAAGAAGARAQCIAATSLGTTDGFTGLASPRSAAARTARTALARINRAPALAHRRAAAGPSFVPIRQRRHRRRLAAAAAAGGLGEMGRCRRRHFRCPGSKLLSHKNPQSKREI